MKYRVVVYNLPDQRLASGLVHVLKKMADEAIPDGDALMESISHLKARYEEDEEIMRYRVVVEDLPDHIAAQWLVDMLRKQGVAVRYEEQEEEDA